MGEAARGLGLAAKALVGLNAFGIHATLALDHLDGDGAAEEAVRCLIDNAHRAAAERAPQLVFLVQLARQHRARVLPAPAGVPGTILHGAALRVASR